MENFQNLKDESRLMRKWVLEALQTYSNLFAYVKITQKLPILGPKINQPLVKVRSINIKKTYKKNLLAAPLDTWFSVV